VPLSPLSQSLLEERQLPQVVRRDSNLLSKRGKRAYDSCGFSLGRKNNWLLRAAEVTLTLKNGGHEPFKPEQYGNSIIITRSFTQNGSSSYKIKNHNAKTVSTKRDELSAILDHFLIDVDNPMNILTQGELIACTGLVTV